MATDRQRAFANEREELEFLRQRMAVFDEYQRSAYAAHAAEMKEDGKPPFKGITGYGKRTAALIMMERDELAKRLASTQQMTQAVKLLCQDWLARPVERQPDLRVALDILLTCLGVYE